MVVFQPQSLDCNLLCTRCKIYYKSIPVRSQSSSAKMENEQMGLKARVKLTCVILQPLENSTCS